MKRDLHRFTGLAYSRRLSGRMSTQLTGELQRYDRPLQLPKVEVGTRFLSLSRWRGPNIQYKISSNLTSLFIDVRQLVVDYSGITHVNAERAISRVGLPCFPI
jgi:hypothetical protein